MDCMRENTTKIRNINNQMNMGVAAIRQILRQNTTSEENAAAVRQFRRAIQVLREENVYPQDDVSEQTEVAVTLHITNDGRQPEGDITPRGGLVYLEKQITRAGGRMEIQSQPEFLLTVTFPVGAEKQEQEVWV